MMIALSFTLIGMMIATLIVLILLVYRDWVLSAPVPLALPAPIRLYDEDEGEDDESSYIEIEIGFHDERIRGNCENCTGADVAEALIQIAHRLRRCVETPESFYYDNGVVYVDCEEQLDYTP